MRVTLIRHGRTQGNLEKRYVGNTDEGILEEEMKYLKFHATAYEPVTHVYCSPMKRCMETANIIYPQATYTTCLALRECDFGRFEYHNYIELDGNEDYQAWVDSNGMLPFPKGESMETFQKRCVQGFRALMEDAILMQYDTIACVVHGGTIMAIMETFARPKRTYFDWQVDNLAGYYVEIVSNHEEEIKMTSYQKIERES